MTYAYKLPLKAFIFFLILAAGIVWVVIVIMCTAFKSGGGPISNGLKLQLFLPTLLIAFLIVRYYSLKYRHEITLDAGMFHMIYDKRRKKSDIHLNARDIQVFEIIYLDNEPEYDCCNIYSSGTEIASFGGSVVPQVALLDFCKQNGIEPSILTMSLKVFFVLFKRKHLIIQYYDKKKKDKKIEAGDIRLIELEKLNPVSDSLNHYVIYTLAGERYEFEYHAVNNNELATFVLKHNISLTEKKMY